MKISDINVLAIFNYIFPKVFPKQRSTKEKLQVVAQINGRSFRVSSVH